MKLLDKAVASPGWCPQSLSMASKPEIPSQSHSGPGCQGRSRTNSALGCLSEDVGPGQDREGPAGIPEECRVNESNHNSAEGLLEGSYVHDSSSGLSAGGLAFNSFICLFIIS